MILHQKTKPSWLPWAIGAVLLLLISGGLIALIITGKTRKAQAVVETPEFIGAPSTTAALLPRRLDGVMVPAGEEAFMARSVMVENHVDARPLSGVSKANVAFEVPVEGGITRFLLLFDATTTVNEIGPVRSARPYYVDWTTAWRAVYFHVGGSPEALDKIRSLPTFLNIDEMGSGQYFWRDHIRYAPHNTYTSQELMTRAIDAKHVTSTPPPNAWHFQDAASSTERGTMVNIKIAYGGSYNVTWKYDANRGVYVRWQSGKLQNDKDGSGVESENVVVIKTDAQVLDDKGRLKLRTTGNGEATGYRDGKKFLLRWRRGPGEEMRFETQDGGEYLLTRGRTWIEVTTDDRVYAGLEQ